MTLFIPKGERNWEYKAYLKEVFENVYSTKEFITYRMGLQVSYCLGSPARIVQAGKKRRKIGYGQLRGETGTILRRLSEYKGVEMIEGKACIDHIHVCLSIPPKFSVSTIVGYLKGKSAMILFEKYSRLKKNFPRLTYSGREVTISGQEAIM